MAESNKEPTPRELLVAEKIAAGLTRPQAEEIADRQLAHDAELAKAAKKKA